MPTKITYNIGEFSEANLEVFIVDWTTGQYFLLPITCTIPPDASIYLPGGRYLKKLMHEYTLYYERVLTPLFILI